MRGRREFPALVAAFALHAGVLGFLRLTQRDDQASDEKRLVPSRSEVSWDVELLQASADEPAPNGTRNPLNAGETTPARASRRSSAVEPSFAGAEAATEEGGDAPPALEIDSEGATPSKPIDLGLGPNGWQRWVTAPGGDEARRVERTAPRKNRFQVFRAPPVSTTGGLQEGLEAHDRELGLGPSGRVLSALRAAAHATVAPEVGVARFNVTVNRTGTVDVTVAAASGEVERWKEVAVRVANDLRSAPPRIPPPREGLKLVVELIAEETLPNGTKTKSLQKPHLDAPPLRFQSSEAAREQLKRENPTTENPTADSIAVKTDTPGLYLAENGKVFSYRVGVGSISPGYRLGAAAGPVMQGSFEPTHFDAKAQRMVRTRIVEESMF